MRTRLLFAALPVLLVLVGCGRGIETPEPRTLPEPAAREVSFRDDIQPIIETHCLVCHACFDAPCQFKLEDAEALVRGSHPLDTYDGSRTEPQTPLRMHIDAQDEPAWRALGFRSVLEPGQDTGSLLYNMLALAHQRPFEANSKLPEQIKLGLERDNQCVGPEGFDEYARKHPLEGMPLGMAGLSDEDFSLVRAWFEQGAEVSFDPVRVSEAEQTVIDRWETRLNDSDDRRRLVARWIYEHLFLAHLYFDDLTPSGERPPNFFEMVRSHTPPGETIRPVATRQPNQDPEGPVYYRLRPIEGAIAHKRHITFPVSEALAERIEALFFEDDWEAGTLPGYSYEERANPFLTFAAIPARARYQFMLDQAEYFTRTFIRGPVCRGQIATDVIRDHFWTIFQDPEHDLFVTHPGWQDIATPLLAMPGQNDSLLEAGPNWNAYRERRNEYAKLRAEAYRESHPEGASVEHIWDGDGDNDNALLTILRHHDSASVRRGLIGRVPQTIWWMDYPLFERTYYELVVNFDVYGNIAHQVQTRLYFDLIRNGSEHNFLRLLPPGARSTELDDWYRGAGKIRTHISYAPLDDKTPTQEAFATDAQKQEIGLRLLSRFDGINAMSSDPLNRCSGGQCVRGDAADWIRQADRHLARLAAVPARELPGVRGMPDVTFLRVHRDDGDRAAERTVYTLVRNRAHSNVAFMAGEDLRYEPEKDELLVYPGIMGSFPNFIFDVPASEVEAFSQQLGAADKEEAFESVVVKWGIRRTHPGFWSTLHDFTAWQLENEPLEAGIFDINRYKNM